MSQEERSAAGMSVVNVRMLTAFEYELRSLARVFAESTKNGTLDIILRKRGMNVCIIDTKVRHGPVYICVCMCVFFVHS